MLNEPWNKNAYFFLSRIKTREHQDWPISTRLVLVPTLVELEVTVGKMRKKKVVSLKSLFLKYFMVALKISGNFFLCEANKFSLRWSVIKLNIELHKEQLKPCTHNSLPKILPFRISFQEVIPSFIRSIWKIRSFCVKYSDSQLFTSMRIEPSKSVAPGLCWVIMDNVHIVALYILFCSVFIIISKRDNEC